MRCPRWPFALVASVPMLAACTRDDPAAALPPAASAPSAPAASVTAAASVASIAPSAAPEVPDVSADPEQRAVRDTFLAYQKALLARKGDEAAGLVSEKTIAYFESMRVAVLQMPAAEVRKAPLMDKIMVLMLRGRTTKRDLERWTGRNLFVTGVDNGWIGDEVRHVQPGEVQIEGEMARLKFRTGGRPVASGLEFLAYREKGGWKLDVMSIRNVAEPALRASLRELNPDEDRAVQSILETVLRKKLDVTIWEPLSPQAPIKL
jgi:hypothetical protein